MGAYTRAWVCRVYGVCWFFLLFILCMNKFSNIWCVRLTFWQTEKNLYTQWKCCANTWEKAVHTEQRAEWKKRMKRRCRYRKLCIRFVQNHRSRTRAKIEALVFTRLTFPQCCPNKYYVLCVCPFKGLPWILCIPIIAMMVFLQNFWFFLNLFSKLTLIIFVGIFLGTFHSKNSYIFWVMEQTIDSRFCPVKTTWIVIIID